MSMCDDPNLGLPESLLDSMESHIDPVDNDALTECDLDGSGIFDRLMKSVKLHLRSEYESNRISGAEYARAYIELTQAAMANAVQFLTQRDQAYWTAVNAQITAYATKAQIFATCSQMALNEAQKDQIIYQTEYLLPSQTDINLAQEDQLRYQTDFLLPSQKDLQDSQTETEIKKLDVMDSQITSAEEQDKLTKQQVKSFKAKDWLAGISLTQSMWAASKSVDLETRNPDWLTGESGGTTSTTGHTMSKWIRDYIEEHMEIEE